jgi:hypothetical protein
VHRVGNDETGDYKKHPNAKVAISEERTKSRKRRQKIAVGIAEMVQHNPARGDAADDLNGLKPFHTVRRVTVGVFEKNRIAP